MRTVIALGANLGDPSKQISLAVDALRDIMIVSALSALYETEPFDVPDDQPMYTNAVAIGECALEPRELMKELLAIESQLGRQRTFANAARTIDLDLIDYINVLTVMPGFGGQSFLTAMMQIGRAHV